MIVFCMLNKTHTHNYNDCAYVLHRLTLIVNNILIQYHIIALLLCKIAIGLSA